MRISTAGFKEKPSEVSWTMRWLSVGHRVAVSADIGVGRCCARWWRGQKGDPVACFAKVGEEGTVDSSEALEFVAQKVGDRNLVWVDDLGTETAALLGLKQLSHCYTPLSAPPSERIETLSVEAVTRRRFGGKAPPMTGALGVATARWVKSALGKPAVFISWMPSALLEILMTNTNQVEYVTTSLKTYRTVEDKAYVEAGLRAHPDVNMIPWRQVADTTSRRAVLAEALRDGPLVLRSGVPHAGGSGHELILDENKLTESWIAVEHGPIHAGPYIPGQVLGMGACVFPDGGVVVHVPQTSLVGIPRTTSLVFGDSGNDIGSIKHVEPEAIGKLEAAARAAGTWLYGQGFLGAYGIQAIVEGAECHFLELNPRFLSSMRMSTMADIAMGRPSIALDHLMAWFGHDSYPTAPMNEMIEEQPSSSQIFIHNIGDLPIWIGQDGVSMPAGFSADILPDRGVVVEPGAIVSVVTSGECVTEDGHSITEIATRAVDALLAAFEPAIV
jgi:hypothetical protein